MSIISRAEEMRDDAIITFSAHLGTFPSVTGPIPIVCQSTAIDSSDQTAPPNWLQRSVDNEMVTRHLICIHCTALLTAIHRADIVADRSQLFSFSTK